MNSSLVKTLILITLLSALLACTASEPQPETPIETFKAYTRAIKAKDITKMKLLLSADSMKMNETEAKSRGVSVDDVVKNETLFSENQKTVKLRNERIEGDKASLEVENTFGTWETVPFVKEEGIWKIDKKGYAQRMFEEVNQSNQRLDDIIRQSREPVPAQSPETP